MTLKFGTALIALSFVLTASDVEGKLSMDSILDIISPRNPVVHRVRRIEDANGDPLAALDTAGLCEQYGYPAEQHNITSDDGYNIAIFRVLGSPTKPPAKGKPVVYMQSGLLTSSDSWAIMGPEIDLVFTIADAGYDVWLGNIRGNSYGRSHRNLTTANKEFWDFSWHEAAIMDTAKGISYALEYTGQKKLFYIGHSMGTTISFVLLTQRPEYNEKIRLVVDLAPTAHWESESNILFQILVHYADAIKATLVDLLDKHDVFPQSKSNVIFIGIIRAFCGKKSRMRALCLTLWELGVGPSIEPLDIDGLLPRAIPYLPAGASARTLLHFAQCLRAGYLQKYDYGRVKNLQLYGTEKPPAYNMSMVTAPVALIYGNTDPLSLVPNVIGLSKLLPNLATCEAVPAPIFSHLDFVISKYSKELLHNRILELFSLYMQE